MTINRKFQIFSALILTIFLITIGAVILIVKNNQKLIGSMYLENTVPTVNIIRLSTLIRDIPFRMAATLADQYSQASSRNQLLINKNKINMLWPKLYKNLKNNKYDKKMMKQIEVLNTAIIELNKFSDNLAEAYTKSEMDDLAELMEDTWPDHQPVLYNSLDYIVNNLKTISANNYKDSNNLTKKYLIASAIISIVMIIILLGAVIYFVKVLRNLASSILIGNNQIIENSKKLVEKNTELSSRTQEQASSLEETASTLEEITATTKQNSENSKIAFKLAQDAASVAHDGSESGKQVEIAMKRISESNAKINNIVSMVSEISFQTNILAINAAIEAASAGAQGKGFAVVSIEVRGLAQKAEIAAKEISDLLKGATMRIENGQEFVHNNLEKVEEANNMVEQVKDVMQEISSATGEQHSAVEQINQAVTSLDSVTQQNATLVDEIENISKVLDKHAAQSRKIIGVNFDISKINVTNKK